MVPVVCFVAYQSAPAAACQRQDGLEAVVLRVILASIVVALATLACDNGNQRAGDQRANPNEHGVLHHLSDATAADVLGFQPIHPIAIPADFAIQELWGQASLLDDTE